MNHQMDVKFFMGSNTKKGFMHLFNKLKDPKCGNRFYILKGGPGSGKSTLMKRVAKALAENGHYIEYMPCASDPNSLDAIYDHEAKIVIVDGTAPHTLDPDYPGAYDMIINLGEAWSSKHIANRKNEIINLSREIKNCHQLAGACIKSAASLLDQNRLIAKDYLKAEAIKELVDKIIENLKAAPLGTESHRLLSAVSVGKTVFFNDTLANLCPRLVIIEDQWGYVSDVVMSEVRDYAVRKKLDFITCYCSINAHEKIDHLLFPSIGFGISTSNPYHHLDDKSKITAEDLMNPPGEYNMDSMKKNLSFAKELIITAGGHVAKAKALHDDLERYYITAMDFDKINPIYKRLIDEILNS